MSRQSSRDGKMTPSTKAVEAEEVLKTRASPAVRFKLMRAVVGCGGVRWLLLLLLLLLLLFLMLLMTFVVVLLMLVLILCFLCFFFVFVDNTDVFKLMYFPATRVADGGEDDEKKNRSK